VAPLRADSSAGHTQSTAAAGHTPATAQAPQAQATHAGPDLAWIAACAGVLLAAALLGLSEDGRRASRRGRDQLVGMLRPLLGRR
jgi:hypothetical protein